MLRAVRPDLLVVASPHETHEALLRLALRERVHVLCEKPLCWGAADPAASAEEVARAFLAGGLHLAVNCQWPLTLPTYRALHPGVLDRAPRTFAMRLSPRSRGDEMLPDALPHALSLLHAVLPDEDARVEDASRTLLDERGEATEVRFVWRAGGAAVEASVTLCTCDRPPRPASYAFDGHEARREVDLDGYRMTFVAGATRLPLPDPMRLLVDRVLATVAAGPPERPDPAAVPGMRNLVRLCAASATAGAPR
jgi:predicted dehydrogenase